MCNLKTCSLLVLLTGCNYTYTVNVSTRTGDQLIMFEDKKAVDFQICYHGDYYFSPVHGDGWTAEMHCCRGAEWYEVLNMTRSKKKIELD